MLLSERLPINGEIHHPVRLFPVTIVDLSILIALFLGNDHLFLPYLNYTV